MMKGKEIFVLSVFVLVVCTHLVSSAPPFISSPTVTEGITIEHPIVDPVKINEFHEFHFHIFNASTGMPMNGTGVTCFFHLYNKWGIHIFKLESVPFPADERFDYEVNVSSGNFSYSGQYSFIFQCNTSTQGGFYEHDFLVNGIGEALTTEKSILYSLIWIVSFLMFLGLLIYGLGADGNNKKDEMSGYVLAVSNVKYLKIFSLAICYVILVFLSYFSWMLCYSYLDMEFMSSIFQFIFYALAIATLPLFILLVYILIANGVRDHQIGEMISRGLRVRE
jgi:hypothetical protein